MVAAYWVFSIGYFSERVGFYHVLYNLTPNTHHRGYISARVQVHTTIFHTFLKFLLVWWLIYYIIALIVAIIISSNKFLKAIA